MEDRYSVLIKFVDQSAADAFYSNFNGKKFSPVEVRGCHKICIFIYMCISSIHSIPFSFFFECKM